MKINDMHNFLSINSLFYFNSANGYIYIYSEYYFTFKPETKIAGIFILLLIRRNPLIPKTYELTLIKSKCFNNASIASIKKDLHFTVSP